MIALLRGTVISQEEHVIILDVNGVGYEINLTASGLDKIRGVSDPVSLFTHLHLKDDSADLYGFATADEKLLFEKIITVSGMGRKTALNILKTLSRDQFILAINSKDEKMLTQVSGVGKKSAQRLILELQDAFKDSVTLGEVSDKIPLTSDGAYADALAALGALGFSYNEAETMLHQAIADLGPVSDLQVLLKKALALVRKRGR